MARGRQPKPELTESWDDVTGSDDFDSEIYSHEEERKELGSQYVSSQDTFANTQASNDTQSTDDERMTRSRTSRAPRKSVKLSEPEQHHNGPELIMPLAPGGMTTSAKMRAQTPHFRMNQRSLTSDAGFLQRKAEAERAKKKTTTTKAKHEAAPVVRGVLAWLLDIIRIAVNNPLVKYALAAWLVIGAMILVKNFATTTLNNALSPLCRHPIVSSFLPFCESSPVHGIAEFDKLMQAQAQFEEVLSSSANGATLPLDMKRSEASIRDVRQVVSYSNLPSKNELVFEFGHFIELARVTGANLAKFNMRIGHSVDKILSTNRWTLQVIDGVVSKEIESGGNLITGLLDSVNIFAPFQPVPMRDVLVEQYLRHTSAVEAEVLSLIDFAQQLLTSLDDLDGRLDTIAGIVTRDGIILEDNKDALFATLWTKFGGNRKNVAKLDKQLDLLREVGSYRRLAWAHVSGTIVKLQAIQYQLEDLRERVALPEVVGNKIPIEVHIENINLGIERLEQERDASRRISDEAAGRWQVRAGQAIDGPA